MESVFSAASRRTNSQGEKKGPGRDGALKTDWTKPWHGAASYGDRMAPAMVSGDGRAAWSAGFEAQATINGRLAPTHPVRSYFLPTRTRAREKPANPPVLRGWRFR
jgi:hypothetical protein